MKPFIGNVFRTFGVLHNPIKLENIEFVDVGTYTPESCDYPEIARKVDISKFSNLENITKSIPNE